MVRIYHVLRHGWLWLSPIWHGIRRLTFGCRESQGGKDSSPVQGRWAVTMQSFPQLECQLRWLNVFSSRRGDGPYTRLYLASIDDKVWVTEAVPVATGKSLGVLWKTYILLQYFLTSPNRHPTFDVPGATNEIIMSDKRTIIKEKRREMITKEGVR